jgi:hypothetical protein
MYAIVANTMTTNLYDTDTNTIGCVTNQLTMEQCSLLFPLQRGAGPMALMLWLEWVT